MAAPYGLIDERLKNWAVTDRQIECIDAVNASGGSISAAARLLKSDLSTVSKIIRKIRKRAASAGYSPEHDLTIEVPAPFRNKGTSGLYKIDRETGDKRLVLQWVKTERDREMWEEFVQDSLRTFFDDLPTIEPPTGPVVGDSDIIPWIQIGDAHIGMLAHAYETGQGFDLDTAERELCAAIGILLDELPPVARLVVQDLGDGTHFENFKAITENSGHALDAADRFPNVIKTYSRVMRYIVEKALTKAQVVDVIVNQGNHSRTNDVWMAELLRVAYNGSGRVNVVNNDSPFIAYRMGKTFVLSHHGDKCKPAQLAQVMATDYAKDWGETIFRYIDGGHVHHNQVLKEHPGVVFESFNNLAAPDKYAHDGGWRSKQSITVVLRSRAYGEVGRRRLPIEQVRDHILKSVGKGKRSPAFRGKSAFVA